MTEKMKPSRIGWIKDIPESWKTSKVKFLATEPDTLFLDGDWIESDIIEKSSVQNSEELIELKKHMSERNAKE